MHRFLTVALAEEIQQEIATMRDFGYPATHLAQAVKEAASGPRPQGGDGLWLRVGLAVAGGTMALAAARRLGFLGEPRSRSASWCESEDQSLQELRLDHQAPNAIPFSAILVSESEATSHRGCRWVPSRHAGAGVLQFVQ